jgi:hypothetical protein
MVLGYENKRKKIFNKYKKMKKKFLSGLAALFMAIAVAFNVSMNMSEKNQLSDFGLANAEALANNELPTGLTGGYERAERLVPDGASASGSINVGTSGAGASVEGTLHYKTIVCCVNTGDNRNACDWDYTDTDCLRF